MLSRRGRDATVDSLPPWWRDVPILPTLKVEVAFADDPGSGTTWTDITSRVRAGSVRFGRTDERTDYQTGSLSLTLDNRDRALDPFNASSPYAGNLTPRKDIRVQATYNSVTYDLFYGQVARWPVTPDVSGDTITEIEAYDALGQLADVKMPPDAFTFQVRRLGSFYNKLTAWLPMGSNDQVIQDVRYEDPKRNFTFTISTPKTEGAPSSFMSGNATTFDGTYGAIGPAVPMQASSGVSGGLVGFWMKTETAGPTGGQNPVLASAGSANTIRVGVNEYGQLEVIYDTFNVNSAFPINDGNWHHVLISHEYPGFGNGTMLIYVDGILIGSDTTGTGTSIPGWQLIGMRNPYATSDSDYFTGALAHITVYNSNTNGGSEDYAIWLYQSGQFGRLTDSVTERGYTADDVIGAIATWSLVNYGTEDWETGTFEMQALKWGGSALDLIQQATRAEGGRTFVSGTGVLNFHNRSHDYTATRAITSQATYSDSDVAGTIGFSTVGELVYSDEYLTTEVTVTSGDGANILVDSPNYTAYGYRAERFDLPLSQSDALEWATSYLSQYDHPTFRVAGWTVLPQGNPTVAYPKVLDARLADRVTFEIKPSRTGTRISQPLILEQITHSFTPEQWETTFSGSPAVQAWLLEDATYGLLEDTTILG